MWLHFFFKRTPSSSEASSQVFLAPKLQHAHTHSPQSKEDAHATDASPHTLLHYWLHTSWGAWSRALANQSATINTTVDERGRQDKTITNPWMQPPCRGQVLPAWMSLAWVNPAASACCCSYAVQPLQPPTLSIPHACTRYRTLAYLPPPPTSRICRRVAPLLSMLLMLLLLHIFIRVPLITGQKNVMIISPRDYSPEKLGSLPVGDAARSSLAHARSQLAAASPRTLTHGSWRVPRWPTEPRATSGKIDDGLSLFFCPSSYTMAMHAMRFGNTVCNAPSWPSSARYRTHGHTSSLSTTEPHRPQLEGRGCEHMLGPTAHILGGPFLFEYVWAGCSYLIELVLCTCTWYGQRCRYLPCCACFLGGYMRVRASKWVCNGISTMYL